MTHATLTDWFPDRPLTWFEVVLAVAVLLQVGFFLLTAETILWRWVVAGFVTFVIAVGPASQTETGQRIGSWFRAIGVSGRFAVITLFAVAIGIVIITEPIPAEYLGNFSYGGLAGTALFYLVYLLYSREIEGLWAERVR